MSYGDAVFEGFTSANLVWGHDGGDGEHPDEWHIIGPRMPRISPVSPTNIAPCGYALSSDSMRNTHRRTMNAAPGAFPEVPKCHFCATFAEQLAHAERDAIRRG
jgi:hypothetical protein